MTVRKKSNSLSGPIIGALAAIIAAIIIARWSIPNPAQPQMRTTYAKKQLAGMVVDETNNSISQAKIDVVGRNEFYVTESNGNFIIPISDSSATSIRLHVYKPGYIIYDKSFDLPSENVTIQLQTKR
jgi:hypothetical protein